MYYSVNLKLDFTGWGQ